MSLSVGRAKLVQALKDLEMRWQKTRMEWDDAMSDDINKTVIEPLEPRVRATVSAMEKMVEVLSRAGANVALIESSQAKPTDRPSVGFSRSGMLQVI